jgi:DNA-binding GntR family transcriptional regulator
MTSDAVYRLLGKEIIYLRTALERAAIPLIFHRRLTQASGNTFLQQSLAVSHLQTHQIRYVAWLSPARVQRSIREHKAILVDHAPDFHRPGAG